MSRLKSDITKLVNFFSGEDHYIINKVEVKSRIGFLSIGVLVIGIFILSWWSARSFILELFNETPIASSIVSVIWGVLILNLYLFLLYTISPAILPTKAENIIRKKLDGVVITLIFRMMFIGMIAVIIAQPLNVYVFSDYANKSLNVYKSEYKVRNYLEMNKSNYSTEIDLKTDIEKRQNIVKNNPDSSVVYKLCNKLLQKIESDRSFYGESSRLLDSLDFYQKFINSIDAKRSIAKKDSIIGILDNLLVGQIFSDSVFLVNLSNEYEQYADDILVGHRLSMIEITKSKLESNKRISFFMNSSNFYSKRIKLILSENPASWFYTLFVIVVFLMPIYIKYNIRNSTNFYELKKNLEETFIKENYNHFLPIYSKKLVEVVSQTNEEVKHRVLDFLKSQNIEDESLCEYYITKTNTEEESEVFEKYEYWADPPFRTKQRAIYIHKKSEGDLLKNLYSE